MTVINARYCYVVGYKVWKGRRIYREYLNAIEPIVIEDVSGADAPVAYHISSGNPWHLPFDVRLHDGALWWPLYGDHGPLQAGQFIELARTDWERANAVLDPLNRTYERFAATLEERFENEIVTTDESDRTKQAEQVRKDAARLIFIDGAVYADAGEPVWYAVVAKGKYATVDLVIGPASLDRQDRLGCHMQCIDRGTRLTAAQLGFAFGLDEVEAGLTRLLPDAVHHWVSKVVSTSIHVAGPATEVCAIAVAHRLWETACHCHDAELRRRIPCLANAWGHEPPPADLPYREMLESYIPIEETALARKLPYMFHVAQELLERLGREGYVANDQDEAALEALGDYALSA